MALGLVVMVVLADIVTLDLAAADGTAAAVVVMTTVLAVTAAAVVDQVTTELLRHKLIPIV